MLWPEWLSISYPHPGNTLPAWQITGAAALLVAITVLVLVSQRRYLIIGWLWFLVSMAPMSGIIHFGDQAMADRYAYQPLCGLFIAICWLIAEFGKEHHVPAAALASAAIAVLLVLSAVTMQQISYWRTNLELWSHALKVNPNDVTAELWLAQNLGAEGRGTEQLLHLRHVLAIDPNNGYGNLQMAFYQHQHGNLPEAIAYYEVALRGPKTTAAEKRRALINLGHCYGKLGDTERAQQSFEAAAKIPQPSYRYAESQFGSSH
jgi:tetratricopeptide (TPR) repeat protein